MTNEEMQVVFMVQDACKKNPEMVSILINSCIKGLSEREEFFRNQAHDMEVAACAFAALAKDTRVSPNLKKTMNNVAKSKIEKYDGKTFLKWEEYDLSVQGNES